MAGGMHGWGHMWQGACMVAGGCMVGGCAWQRAYVAGGMHGRGACIGECMAGTPPMKRMTDTCKNITLPQTSFASDNDVITFYIPYSKMRFLFSTQNTCTC